MLDDQFNENLIAGPEVGASVKPKQSLARELIVKYKAGVNPVLDQQAATEEAAAPDLGKPLTSRDWANRKAVAIAKEQYLSKEVPGTNFSNLTFDGIWGRVLKAEGGYANNIADPGGETNFGISKRSYPNENIAALTPQRAQEIFKNDFYDAVGGDTLLKINPGLAAHVSDMAFNAGPKTAIKLMYDAVRLPRQTQITPELLDRLSESENLIKDYSVARLTYYSGLANAPTFMKGWTNRVSNLNKSLNVKSGLQGAYKAARNLDTMALIDKVYSSQEQLAPKFRELDAVEIERLQRANEMLSPGYIKPSDLKKQTSSIGDVFKATYDAKYFTNTIDGMNELALRSAREASDANRKALGTKFDKSIVEKLSFGLYGGVQSIQDWQEEVNRFKQEHPEIKLPFETAAQVYELNQKKAKEIEDRYNSLDSGNFKDGIAASLNKLGHVVAGYLPGEIIGSMSDRLEGAVNLLPLPGATSAANIAKGAAAVMAGTGAAQAVVQPKRQELGLEGGLQQGVENTVAAGVGQAVLGSLVSLGTKLWRSGSKETAKEVFKETERLKKAIRSEMPDAQTMQLQRAVETVEQHAKELARNPFGTDHNAKLKYEELKSQAMSDILEGKPIREMTDNPVKVLDNTDKLKTHFSQMYSEEDIAPDYAAGIAEWNKIKQAGVNKAPVFEATVPIETEAGAVQMFKTKDEIDSLIGSGVFGDEYAVATQAANGEWYASRPADLESITSPTSRFEQDSEVVGSVRGFIGSQDVDLAKKYPDLVRTSAIETRSVAPTYPQLEDVLGQAEYLNQLKEYGTLKLTNLDQRYEASLQDLSKLAPDTLVDIGDTVDQGVSIKSLVDELQDERHSLKEMFSCMVGAPVVEGV